MIRLLAKKEFGFAPEFEDFIRQNALDSYARVLARNKGRIITRRPERSVTCLSFKDDERTRNVYLKVVGRCGFKKYLKSIFCLRRPELPTCRESRELQRLAKKGVAVCSPIAWGRSSFLLWPLQGFLMVDEVKGKSFIELYEESDRAGKMKLMALYGRMLGRLHKKGCFQVVRPNDMICARQPNVNIRIEDIVLIDREYVEPGTDSYEEEMAFKGLSWSIIGSLRLIKVDSLARYGPFVDAYCHEIGLTAEKQAVLRNVLCCEITAAVERRPKYQRYVSLVRESIHALTRPSGPACVEAQVSPDHSRARNV